MAPLSDPGAIDHIFCLAYKAIFQVIANTTLTCNPTKLSFKSTAAANTHNGKKVTSENAKMQKMIKMAKTENAKMSHTLTWFVRPMFCMVWNI